MWGDSRGITTVENARPGVGRRGYNGFSGSSTRPLGINPGRRLPLPSAARRKHTVACVCVCVCVCVQALPGSVALPSLQVLEVKQVH
jgi:hypothetical protein